MSIRVKFEPRDVWIGVYWNREPNALKFYICFLPLLPVIVTVPR